MPTESDLQRRIIRALECRNAYVVNVVVAGRSGTPDLVVCFDGRFIALEVKVPHRYPTALQRVEMAMVQTAGGHAYVVRSVAEAIQALHASQPSSPATDRGST